VNNFVKMGAIAGDTKVRFGGQFLQDIRAALDGGLRFSESGVHEEQVAQGGVKSAGLVQPYCAEIEAFTADYCSEKVVTIFFRVECISNGKG
jgi:hypothetical protein